MKLLKKCAAFALAATVAASVGAAAGCAPAGVDYIYPDTVSVYETTGTKAGLLSRKSSLTFSDYAEDYSRQAVTISTGALYQEYQGYGASLTHSSAHLIMQADEETRTALLYDLFSRGGANLSIVRIPIGASDYIPGNQYFTCDDLPEGQTDMSLEHFNLDNDGDIIAVCKLIAQINPDVSFMASPWSAPAWMKRNQSLVGALSYPTMDMNAIEAANVTALVGQKLAAQGFKTEIVSWDFNYGSSSGAFADTYFEMLFDEYADTAGQYTHTVGFHGYDGDGYYNPERMYGLKDGIQKVSSQYGRASLITEITESSVSNDFAGNLTYACSNVVVNPCAAQTDGDGNWWNGCGGALYWNLVLDSDGQPTPASHGGNECYGVISLDVNRFGEYTYTKSSAYYAMAQVSKFMYDVEGVPCRALAASTDYVDLNVMAFYRNDGAIIVVVCNTNESNGAPVDIVIDGKKVSYDMAPQSMVTFVC